MVKTASHKNTETKSGEIRTVLTSFEIIKMDSDNRDPMPSQDIPEYRQIDGAPSRPQIAEHEQHILAEGLTKRKEFSELKSRFITTVSHEFRTPLAIILVSSQLLKNYRERMTVQRQLEHLETIEVQVRHLTEMIDWVLTTSESDSHKPVFNPERLNMERFCRTIVDEFRPTAPTHDIEFTSNGNCGEAAIDPKLMRHVLYNLLSDAVKYSPQGGVISLELACNQDEAIIRVTDEGVGIPESDLKHLFEVFHRAANVGNIPGAGLGLAIVKRAVEAHRGSISVESTVNKGTTFIVTLPLVLPSRTTE